MKSFRIMRKQRSGNVINVSSIAARHGGGGGRDHLCRRQGFRLHGNARLGQGSRRRQHPRECGVARRDHDAVSRALFDGRAAQGDAGDGAR